MFDQSLFRVLAGAGLVRSFAALIRLQEVLIRAVVASVAFRGHMFMVLVEQVSLTARLFLFTVIRFIGIFFALVPNA